MDTGDIAIVATLGVGFVAILITQFALTRQANSDSRADARETRSEIRELSARLGERVSETELKQARLDAQNEILLRHSHSHTHEIADD